MRKTLTVYLSTLTLLAGTAEIFAQGAVVLPGTAGTTPLSRNGVGADRPITGNSEQGRGGAGGAGGGATTNGTAAGSGTATGGNPSGYPDRN